MISSPERRLLISHSLAATAMAMPWPVLLTQVWIGTSDELLLGLAGAARMLPYVLLSPFAGILADFVRRSVVLRWSTALRVLSLGTCAIALAVGRIDVAVLCAVVTVALGAPAYPAAVAAMPGLAGPRAGRLTSLLVTAEASAFVVGPAVGGLLLSAGWGSESVWWAVLGTACAWLLLRRVDTGPVSAAAVPGGQSRLRRVVTAPGVAVAILIVALVNFVEAFASVALIGLSHQTWGEGDRGYGIATAALGFGSLAAPLLLGRIRLRGSLVASAAGFTAAGLAPGVAPALPVLAVAGAAGTVVECVSTDVLQRSVPDPVRAFALGLTDAVMVLAAMIGALLAPTLVAWAGAPITFAATGGLLVVAAVLVGRPARVRVDEVTAARRT